MYDLSGQGWELNSTANDPQNGPQMILDLKWSRYCTEPTTNLDRFVTKNCKRLVYDIRKLKQRRRRRQRERQKSNWFRSAKQQLCTCIMLFCTFLCRQCTTTTWNCLIPRFSEDVNTVNTRQRLSFSFPELRYSLFEFNSRENCQHLTKGTRWNKRDKVWCSATSLIKPGRFRSRRRLCWLNSLLYITAVTSHFAPCSYLVPYFRVI